MLCCALALGCGEGLGNPFGGSQWDVGTHHISFSHGVADWQTATDTLVLKFNLLTGSAYPDATVTVADISTLSVNQPKVVPVHIAISQDTTYESNQSDLGAQATLTFSRLDLTTLGGVSGTITGNARRVPDDGLQPVTLEASFDDTPITN
jgi:hypothetical protein